MTPTDLLPHPEGGRFREVFRSAVAVQGPVGHNGRDETRAACTHIYFHLGVGECSRWHRVTGDEIWNLYRGAVRLWTWEGTGEPAAVDLSAAENRFCHVIPAGVWQAAEPLTSSGGTDSAGTDEALVGCTVAPGFAFADFTMLHEGEPAAARLMATRPDLARLLAPAAGVPVEPED